MTVLDESRHTITCLEFSQSADYQTSALSPVADLRLELVKRHATDPNQPLGLSQLDLVFPSRTFALLGNYYDARTVRISGRDNRSHRGRRDFLGTERARALWNMCSPFFNPDYAEMVDKMIGEVPCIDFWEVLETVK